MPALATERIRNVEGQIIAAGIDCRVQQEPVLILFQMLIQIDVAGRASIKIAGEIPAMELQLVQHIDFRIFDREKVTVVAVARDEQLLLAIPGSILHAEVFCGHHFGIPQNAVAAAFTVCVIDRLKDSLRIGDVIGIIGIDRNSQRFCAFDESVYADRQVLLLRGDKAGVIYGKQSCLAAFHQDRIECQQVFVNLFDLLFHGFTDVVHTAVPDGVLHQTGYIDGNDALASSCNAACAKCKTERVVLQFITQAAAGCKTVNRIRTVHKETVSLGPHLSGEVRPLAINVIVTVIQQVQRLHRESQQLASSFVIKPTHESFLLPADRIPLHRRTIRKDEVLKHTAEIWFVEVCDVPEYRLIPSGCCRLIEAVDNLFKRIGDYLINASFSGGNICRRLSMQIIVIAILAPDKVIHIAEPFRR